MRLIVVSNRLPLTITRAKNGFEYTQTSGGLVTGLKALQKNMDFVWVGNISGMDLTDHDKQVIATDCWARFNSIPVFIPKKINEDSYNGFCNNILWPLVHNFVDDVAWDASKYAAYKQSNTIMCDKVCEIAKDDDMIWIHDYHLMLLPRMVRKRCKKNIKIGFFLHTPFPPSELFATLPVARQIMRGILGSDGVGLHLLEYVAHFLDTSRKCLRAKDLDAQSEITYMPNAITIGERRILVHATPIGIDPQVFRDAVAMSETQTRIAELREKFHGKKVILGVDRTDYIKGIPHRLAAFERYLSKYGTDAVFLQIAVPSRMDVVEYKVLVDQMKFMASDINGKHPRVDDTYFYFLNSSVSFNELCALYAVSDICLITSLRDGMNLVALEYIACQEQGHGKLILSKFAGASSTLPGCVSVNPWETEAVADSIKACADMTQEEATERYEINKRGLETFTALRWGKENMKMWGE